MSLKDFIYYQKGLDSMNSMTLFVLEAPPGFCVTVLTCSLNSKLNWGPEFLTDNLDSIIAADMK